MEGKVHHIVKEVYGKTADVQNIDLDEDRRKKFTVSVKPLYLYFADCFHFKQNFHIYMMHTCKNSTFLKINVFLVDIMQMVHYCGVIFLHLPGTADLFISED